MTADPLASRVIGHVNLASGFRGGERQTQLLVEALARRGCRQQLIARRAAPLAAACRGIPGLEVRECASQPLLAAFAARHCDLLHAHEARAIYACWLGAKLSGAPWLLTRRVDNPFKSSALRDRAYRRAAAVVGVSRAISSQVEARYPGMRCHVVPDAHANLAARRQGPDADDNAAAGRRAPDARRERLRGKTVVGHVGALDHSHKGQGTILAAARLARQSRPELHFVLVGDGRDEARFRAEAADLANVEFAGYVSDVGEWLAAFDLFVFPSLHEGLGSTLLDAMNFGLPIVATRVGGIPDIIEDGVNGLLIDPEQPEALLAGIRRILDDAHLATAMRSANRDKADRYSAEAMADRYAALYREMLAS